MRDRMNSYKSYKKQGNLLVNTAIVEETGEGNHKAAVPSPKWRERLHALRSNTPLLFRMVWESAPRVVVSSLAARVIASLLPLAMLAVTGHDHRRHSCLHRAPKGAAALLLVAGGRGIRAGGPFDDSGACARLLRRRSGGQVHAAHQHAHRGACLEARFDVLRRSRFLRQDGARPRARDRPADHDSDCRPFLPTRHHGSQPCGEHFPFSPRGFCWR